MYAYFKHPSIMKPKSNTFSFKFPYQVDTLMNLFRTAIVLQNAPAAFLVTAHSCIKGLSVLICSAD